ncbi:MAG: hypothetical protein M2R45_00627 [Verrucomicrobia subdivision 3 bacterium]|nr:hypothetical protein [Limisphaerales bacterium]MCS1414490.1 hypothetical protein [Limisphaerales bacterium]
MLNPVPNAEPRYNAQTIASPERTEPAKNLNRYNVVLRGAL